MKKALFILSILAGIILLSLATFSIENKTANSDEDLALSQNNGDYVHVIYFHGKTRCASCIRLEEFSEDLLINDFANEIKQGKVVWEKINFDEDKKWVKEYNLFTQTLIVAKYKNGKQVEWKSLPDIWRHTNNKERFDKYVSDEIRKFLRS